MKKLELKRKIQILKDDKKRNIIIIINVIEIEMYSMKQ